jgi:uncharacterized hydrophobic protein (TIGR00341 family)
MALRLIEVILPSDRCGELRESLEADEVVAHWMEPISPQQTLIRVLLRVEHTEPFLDRLESEFAGSDFRAMLLPVEATIPRVEPKEEESPQQAAPSPEVNAPPEAAPSPRISREELYQQVNEGVQLTRTFAVLVALSALVTAVGLAYDNTTVVIGAMVIAPLLGPNVALSVATTLADVDLGRSAARTGAFGLLITMAVAVPLGALLNVDPSVREIHSRLHAQLQDIVLALASGSAAVLSITTVAPAALIGVMVAVALMPPLVTSGLLLGAGDFDLAMRAMLLFVINVICINLAGVVTLLAQNIRPRTWWEADRARRAIKIALAVWVLLLLMLIGVILMLQKYGGTLPRIVPR